MFSHDTYSINLETIMDGGFRQIWYRSAKIIQSIFEPNVNFASNDLSKMR